MGRGKRIDKRIVPADQVDYAAAEKALAEGGAKLSAVGLPQVRGYLTAELDKAGATMEAAAKVIADAHGARAAQVVSYMGEASVVDVGPDHTTRLKAAEMSLKARGELQDKDGVSVYVEMTDAQLAGIAAGQIDPATLIDLGPRVNEARE